MKTVTYAEVQQLVTKIPEAELPLAYCFLAELAAEGTTVTSGSIHASFCR